MIKTSKDSAVTNSQTFSDIYQSVAKQAGGANMANSDPDIKDNQ